MLGRGCLSGDCGENARAYSQMCMLFMLLVRKGGGENLGGSEVTGLLVWFVHDSLSGCDRGSLCSSFCVSFIY